MRFKSLFILPLFILMEVHAQETLKVFEHSWFSEMYQTNVKTSHEDWSKEIKSKLFDQLREKYAKNHDVLMEMSWEERDKIWEKVYKTDDYQSLINAYFEAYLTSCEERGIQAKFFNVENPTAADFVALRKAYLNSRGEEYQILTPKPADAPRINNAPVYGARPGHEFIYRIAFTGAKPAKIRVKGIPRGLYLDKDNGVIYGKAVNSGIYNVNIEVKNAYGKDKKQITFKIGNKIALTPPLGWNSWNSFACDVTEDNIKHTAEQLINTGLADYGYSYINIDDCWMMKPDSAHHYKGFRDSLVAAYHKHNNEGRIVRKKVRFNEDEVSGDPRAADGTILSNQDFRMLSLTKYVHDKGFKIGIYSSPGPYTCQTYEGSYLHEVQDAKQYAKWGFDYLKYDWCSYRLIADKQPSLEEMKKPYVIMGNAFKNINRDIFYSLCQYGMGKVWEWGPQVGANAWRTSHDIRDNWDSLMDILKKQKGLEDYAAPGYWNDPDMLVVGYVGWNRNLRPTYLSPNEQYTHISLWSLLASPLLIGCDLNRMDDFTFNLLANPEVLKINQDTLGKQGKKIISDNNIHVWTKPLADGKVAVGIFNFGDHSVSYSLPVSQIMNTPAKILDAWKISDLPYSGEKSIPLKVNRHGVHLLVFTPANLQ